jgi:regulator of protease activity HflC (stomatin/prohibitin superfamily)
MFDWIKELLILGYDHLKFWQVVDEWECGVMLRFGKITRALRAGLHWKLPFVHLAHTTESVLHITTTEQKVTTKDDVLVGVEGVVKFRVADPVMYWSTIWQGKDGVDELARAAIGDAIRERNYADIVVGPDAIQQAQRRSRAEVKKYGLDIESISLPCFGRIQWLCFTGLPKDLHIALEKS